MYYRQRIRQKTEPPKRSFDTIVKAVATGVFIASLVLNVVFLAVILGMSAAYKVTKDMDSGVYEKIYIENGSFGFREGRVDEIAIIHVTGFISEFDRRGGLLEYIENPVSAVTNRLSLIRDDKNIRGVLLVIDSPGGEVTASDVLYHRLSSFRRETGLPMVALMKQVAASGGYYVASASEHIVAYPTAIVGSIGVIMGNFNFKDLMDKHGVKYVMIKSGEHKGLLSPFDSVDEEDISIIQAIVDQMLDRFIDAVDEGRKNLSHEDVESLADGRIYAAGDALEKGLIDEIGYLEDAVRVLANLAGIKTPNVVEYQRSRALRDIVGSISMRLIPAMFFQESNIFEEQFYPMRQDGFGIYYLWDNNLSFK
ncbi:MAG: signal peptide peptidase SppA [Spirochaetota bacterium]|nr:MAG: signal peptide peptidase SppA [Spirochaetota bacterium]